MQSILIRKAEAKDTKAIAELLITSFPVEFKLIFGSRLEEGKRALIHYLCIEPVLEGLFVATHSEKVIGALSFLFEDVRYAKLSIIQVFVKYMGIYRGLKSIILGSFIPPRIRRGECFFDFICVSPQHRMRGVGKRLYRYAEKDIQNKIGHIFCFVKSSNIAARKLLRNVGFEETYIRKGLVNSYFSYNPWILMEKHLGNHSQVTHVNSELI